MLFCFKLAHISDTDAMPETKWTVLFLKASIFSTVFVIEFLRFLFIVEIQP